MIKSFMKRTLKVNYNLDKWPRHDDPGFMEALRDHLHKTGPNSASQKHVKDFYEEYHVFAADKEAQDAEENARIMIEQIMKEIAEEDTRLQAYLLAKDDGFSKSPEYYWFEAERTPNKFRRGLIR